MEPPEVEFPRGEDGVAQQAGLFDNPAFGTEEQREDDAGAPFAEGANETFETLQAVGGCSAVHPPPGEFGEETLPCGATLDLPVELGNPAERDNIHEIDTAEDRSPGA